MSDHYTDGRHWDDKVQGWALDDDPYEDALLSREDLKARIAELEAEVQHQIERREEEKLRAVNAEAERDALRRGYEILATKLSEANAELVRLETQPQSD